MPSTFYAIPLPRKGESFLLRTVHRGKEQLVLVDCGWEVIDPKQDLCSWLTKNVPEADRIHRLLLTHEDGDHCQGAPQFIRRWYDAGGTIEEVWLPSLWAPAGASPTRDGWKASSIIMGALEVAPEIEYALSKMDGGHEAAPEVWAGDEERVEEALRRAADHSQVLSALFEKLDEPVQTGTPPHKPEASDQRPSTGYHPGYRLNAFRRLIARGWIEGVLESHSNISDVISVCSRFGIRVRWFDFKQFECGRTARGGDAGFLTPVNAVEVKVRPVPITPKMLFYALSLSRANRECLAFLRHEDEDEPAVLFTGDSRLTTRGKDFPRPSGLPAKHDVIVTAMHHASDHNEDGYRVLETWLTGHDAIFVRNGGWNVRAPAKGFLRARRRHCVRCMNCSLGEMKVKIESAGAVWGMPANSRPCKCR